MPTSDSKSEIKLAIEGLDPQVLERWRQNIEVLVVQKIFALRNGKAILNFDSEGILQQITVEYSPWRRKSG